MEHNQDFSQLRQLLAEQKREMPSDTQVDQFLIEFHRRQRAQLLQPPTLWARAAGWVQERIVGLELVPSLSYGAALAAVAFTAFVGLSQQVQVSSNADSSFKISFHVANRDSAFAMLPSSMTALAHVAPKAGVNTSFIPSRSESATTRFVLANNSPRAYDSTVAF